jgi:hypothetical protein
MIERHGHCLKYAIIEIANEKHTSFSPCALALSRARHCRQQNCA